jgi:hypothetical protein
MGLFCVDALQLYLQIAGPEIFNIDRGPLLGGFTSGVSHLDDCDFTSRLEQAGITIDKDGRDKVVIER